MTAGVYVLSCRLTSGPLWLGIYLFLWWFLLVVIGLFVLHWRYELPCQDKLPEFHYTPILGCIRDLWLVFYPLGLALDKALFGWNSVTGLMYLHLQRIPIYKDLQNYPSVHLTSPHEWDPSVLDYEHPENNGEPDWAIDPNENFQFDPNFDEFGDYVNRSLSILDIR